MNMVISGSAAALGAGAVAVFATPKHVRYTESIEIEASADAIYDHIRFQERLMRWSAWPTETQSDCACEGEDGTIGARTVFYTKKGDRFGHQEVVGLRPGHRVEFTLTSKGPPHKPRLAFELEPISADRTRVVLHFDNEIMRPFNLIQRLVGIVRWTRDMHRKDLAGLKRYAEPPHRTYNDEPARELLAA